MKKNDFLIRARKHRGWRQEDLAERIHVTKGTIGRWERGEIHPERYHIEHLCLLFQMTAPELGLQEYHLEHTHDSQNAAVGEDTFVRPAPNYDPMLPTRNTQLVGRHVELAWIRDRLIQGNAVALTALNGIPGVGKTALATTIVHDAEIRTHFKDGILWAALGPHASLLSILSRWGMLLHISTQRQADLHTIQDWSTALRVAINQQSLLIVIDDAWNVEDAINLQHVGGPNCSYLLTTRFPQIASHLTIEPALIQELSEEESIQLVAMLAPNVVAHQEEKVRHLVKLVGGLPLALTLIGNYLRRESYHGTKRRVSAALDRLQQVEQRLQLSEPHIIADPHSSLPIEIPVSLQTILKVTDQRLHRAAQQALYSFSLFPAKPESFSEEAALAVADCSIEVIDELIDTGFLESHGERYRLHQIISDYAHTQWNNPKDQDRLMSYTVTWLRQHGKDFELLSQELTIILHTMEMAPWSIFLQIIIAIGPFLILRGFYTLAETNFQRALQIATDHVDIIARVRVLCLIGNVMQKRSRNSEEACVYYQEALDIARPIADLDLMGSLLGEFGGLLMRLGKHARANELLGEGLAIARRLNDPERCAQLLKLRGAAFATQGYGYEAEQATQEGLSFARIAGNRELECALLGNLGAMRGEMGNVEDARAYFEESLTIARHIGFREHQSVALSNLGYLSIEHQQYKQAENEAREALEIARELELEEWIGIALTELSLNAFRQKKWGQSETLLQECLSLVRDIQRPRVLGIALSQYGDLCLERNDRPQDIQSAERYYQEILETRPPDDQLLLAFAQFGLARVAALRNQWDQARAAGEQSRAIFSKGYTDMQRKVEKWLQTVINSEHVSSTRTEKI